MRSRRVVIAAASLALLSLAAWAGEDRPAAPPETPPVGSRCLVRLAPVEAGRDVTTTSYEGVVTRSDAEGIGLTVAERRDVVVTRSPLARVPYLDRFFRNVGLARPGPGASPEAWLPIATIRSVERLDAGGGRAGRPIPPPSLE